jgi:tryptophan 2,3-dioxygenase
MNEQILLEKLRRLEHKYSASGQNLESYLDGLFEMDFLSYWDYIHLDTLLSLQSPRTQLPDEKIFIIYHQVTELYFKLILSELEQICKPLEDDKQVPETRIRRINRYFDILIQSFRVMSEGMEPAQFMRFRMALLPASGFQSVQYRYIELMCTSVDNLLETSYRSPLATGTLEEKLEKLYWRSGSTDLETGKKTLTLSRFEEKYDFDILKCARIFQENNLNYLLENSRLGELSVGLKESLRDLDTKANVAWRLAHLHSATRYLKKTDTAVEATGGTNWQRYLPPRFQKVVFFPSVWSEEELNEWGKQMMAL